MCMVYTKKVPMYIHIKYMLERLSLTNSCLNSWFVSIKKKYLQSKVWKVKLEKGDYYYIFMYEEYGSKVVCSFVFALEIKINFPFFQCYQHGLSESCRLSFLKHKWQWTCNICIYANVTNLFFLLRFHQNQNYTKSHSLQFMARHFLFHFIF